MDNNYDRKLVEILKSGNVEEEVSKLPLLDRIKLLDSKYFNNMLVLQSLSKDFVLINEEEFEYLYYNSDNSTFNIIRYCINPHVRYPSSFERLILNFGRTVKDNSYLACVKDPELQWEFVQEGEGLHYSYSDLDDIVLERMLHDKRWKDERENIVECFKDDKYREKYLNKFGMDFKIYAINSFKSEELKEKYIVSLPPNKRGTVIASFKNDETKKKYINGFTNEKASIIRSFSSDEDKIEYLKRYKLVLSQEDRGEIIASFDSMDNIKEYIRFITREKGLVNFITYFDIKKDKEFVIKLTGLLKDQNNIMEVWYSLNYDYEDISVLLINRINNQKLLYEMLNNCDNNSEPAKLIISKLDTRSLCKYLKENAEMANFDAFIYCKDEGIVIEALQHNQISVEYNDKMIPLFEMVARHYNVNLDHLITLAKLTNCSILESMENENIINALNLNEENFNKYLRIFDKKNYDVDMSTVNSIVTSLLHKRFSLEHPEEIELFINTLHNVDDNKMDEAISKIKQVYSIIDTSKYDIDINTLINGVLSKDEKIILTYRDMTYEYLTIKRNIFVNENTNSTLRFCTDLKYEKNSLIKYQFNYAPESLIKKAFANKHYIRYCNLNEEQKALIHNKELLHSLIAFKKHPESYPLTDEMKQNLKTFNELCAIFLTFSYGNYAPIDGVQVEYSAEPTRPEWLASLMGSIDVNKLRDLVFSDDELFEDLLSHLDKYDMVGWANRFSKISEQADIGIDANLVGTIISNYSLIVQMRKSKERFPLISELNFADCLDSDADIYSILIGQEDYRLIRRNPQPNASPKGKKKRIDEAVKCIKKMHERRYITVPPIDEDVTLKNGKTINVMVGNTNDPINLTYGERTGACMRIGGAGRSLFDFCLTNENGFHMSFNDPLTGDLVSRVSCFRNGNTLFLNQLRYSLSIKYDEKDLIEACKILCKKIIEMTKDSKYPIENVVASNGYALRDKRTVDTHCPNIKKGLPDFYSDVSEQAVIIETSNNGELSEIRTNPNAAVRYPIGRAKVKTYHIKKANAAIKHIEALDMFYDGKSIDSIDVPNRNVSVAYVGEDWYIALLENGETISYIQRNSLNREAASKEMEEHIRLIESIKTYGGMSL